MASHLLTKYITGSTRCRSFCAANLNYLWISRTWFLATKAKTMRPSPWKRAFFSFVFIISLLLTQGVIYRKRDSYVLRFSWLLRSGSKKKQKNNNNKSSSCITRMAEQRALWQRNRRRVCASPLQQRSWWMFICPFIRILEPLHMLIMHIASIYFLSVKCVFNDERRRTQSQLKMSVDPLLLSRRI